jgi:GT2 family glycosyltransferase
VISGKPSLTIVIVNWNSGDQLHECLRSIVGAQQPNFALDRVVVVDNASSDGSADSFNMHELPISIIRNSGNRGFAAACNQGALGSRSDYLLFLNPDTQLSPDSLSVPLSFLESPANGDVAIAGIQLIDAGGAVSRSCARLPSPILLLNAILGLDKLFPRICKGVHMREWNHEESRFVGHVIGAFFLTRMDVFRGLGGFDERYFVYCEDLDFSVRAQRTGWRTRYLVEARAYHRGGGTSRQVKAQRLAYSMRSRILLGYKHFSWGVATLLMAGTLIVQPLTHLAYVALGQSESGVKETASGYWLLWKYFTPCRALRRFATSPRT